jgi:hypothetical protein
MCRRPPPFWLSPLEAVDPEAGMSRIYDEWVRVTTLAVSRTTYIKM